MIAALMQMQMEHYISSQSQLKPINSKILTIVETIWLNLSLLFYQNDGFAQTVLYTQLANIKWYKFTQIADELNAL